MPDKKIVGWKVRHYKDFPTYPEHIRRQLMGSAEFGNSPIRDQKAREAHIAELKAQGFTDIVVEPIHPWVNPHI